MKKFVLILLFVFLTTSASYAAGGMGSAVKRTSTTNVRVGAYNTKSNISVVEYDTYGAECGYYIEDGFGMTTKYDKNGNVLSKYKTNQSGKTYVYDKYNHVIGFFQAVSKSYRIHQKNSKLSRKTPSQHWHNSKRQKGHQRDLNAHEMLLDI